MPSRNKSRKSASDPRPADTVREIVLVKADERFIYRYAPGDEAQVLESLIERARDPHSGLGWFDAAVLSHQLGQRFGQLLDEIRHTDSTP